MMIRSGELEYSRLEIQQILLKKSKYSLSFSFPNNRVILEKLNDQLTVTLDKISKLEKIINSNMSDVGDKYKNQSE